LACNIISLKTSNSGRNWISLTWDNIFPWHLIFLSYKCHSHLCERRPGSCHLLSRFDTALSQDTSERIILIQSTFCWLPIDR
jgi:hypothetical protein